MRLFVGIPLSDALSESLELTQKDIFVGPSFKIEPKEKLHITLVYIGEVVTPDSYVKTLKQVLFEPFEIEVFGVGKFINRQVVYYAKVLDSSALSNLASKVLDAINLIDGTLRYKFMPHITLARANKNVSFQFNGISHALLVSQFILFESRDGKYIPIHTYRAQ